MKAIRFLVLLLIPSVIYPMNVEVYFSPDGGCADAIEREIDRAEREILVAMYSFTSSQLAWALVRAKKRGVEVKVVVDPSQVENRFSKVEFLKNRGIKVKVDLFHLIKSERRLEKYPSNMHHKFAVIDRKVVITGSYNWTAYAEKYNDEDCLIFTDAQELAELYVKKFFKLWERN